MPFPSPGLPLDQAPSSPPALEAAPSQGFSGLAPEQESMGGGMQTLQLLLQTAQAVAQGLDILGKMEPALAGLSAQMQQMLRSGVQAALQQGPMGTGASSPSFQGMA